MDEVARAGRFLPQSSRLGSAAEYGDPVTERVAEDHPLRSCDSVRTIKGRAIGPCPRNRLQEPALEHISYARSTSCHPTCRATVALGKMRAPAAGRAKATRRTVRCGRLDVVRDFIPLEFVVRHDRPAVWSSSEWPSSAQCLLGSRDLGSGVSWTRLAIDIRSRGLTSEIDPRLAAIAAAPGVVGDPTRLGRISGFRLRADADAAVAALGSSGPLELAVTP